MSIFENGWNLIFSLFAILGLFFSYFFYKKSKRFKKVCFFHKSINLIKNNLAKLENLEILYEGEKINNLTITNFAIWNEGSETIDNNDVAPSNNMKIKAQEGVSILNYEATFIKNKSNNFVVSLSSEKNIIFVDFDYFDKDEGLVLKIYHTGKSDKDLQLLGAIKGARITFKNLNVKNLNAGVSDKVIIHLMINLPLVALLLNSIFTAGFYPTFNKNGLILIGVWIILNLFMLLVSRKRIPTGFEIVAKDFGYTK